MKDPTAKLIFGKTDKDLLYVRRVVNGVSTDLAVAESMLGVVRRGRLDYLNTELPSFTIDKATKFTITVGAEPYRRRKAKEG